MKPPKKGRARRAKDKWARQTIKKWDDIFGDPRFFAVPIPYITVSLNDYRAMQKAAKP